MLIRLLLGLSLFTLVLLHALAPSTAAVPPVVAVPGGVAQDSVDPPIAAEAPVYRVFLPSICNRSASFGWYRFQGEADSGPCASTNCGPASVAMAIQYTNNQRVSISDVRSSMSGSDCRYTNMADAAKALSRWGVNYATITGMDALYDAVNARGHIAIVPVVMSDIPTGSDYLVANSDQTDRDNRYYSFTGGHILVVKGISSDRKWVIVYDPNVRYDNDTYWYADATPKGFDRYYDYVSFAKAFADNGNRALEVLTAPWPMFQRSPGRTGWSPYLGAQSATLRWHYPLSQYAIHSSAAVGTDGSVYLLSPGGYPNTYLCALSSAGMLKWCYGMTGGNSMTSPAIGADGMIYVGQDSRLFAVKPDGALKWIYQASSYTGGISSPAIGADGTIYIGFPNGCLYALNQDGTLRWRYQTADGQLLSSPTVAVEGTIYVGAADNYVYAFNPNGTLRWRYLTGGQVQSAPTVGVDGVIYAGSHDHFLYALYPNGGLKWRYLTAGIVVSSPAIGSDGTIYVGALDVDGSVYALNPDGTLRWRYPTGISVYSSPAVGADGSIYVGASDNYVYALNPSGTLKWRFQTGGSVYSSPAIGANGAVYISSWDGYVYAFGSAP